MVAHIDKYMHTFVVTVLVICCIGMLANAIATVAAYYSDEKDNDVFVRAVNFTVNFALFAWGLKVLP